MSGKWPDPKYPAEICDIGEKEFWAAWRPTGARKDDEIRQAIAFAAKKQKSKAYQTLTEFHRHGLTDYWQAEREKILAQPKPDPVIIRNLMNNRIRGWHATEIDFGKKIDWATTGFGPSGLCGFHYMGWLQPAITRYVQSGNPTLRQWLIDLVIDYYTCRNQTYPRGKAGTLNIHPVYYELGAAAKTDNFDHLYFALLDQGDLPAAAIEGFNKLFLGFARSLSLCQTSGYRDFNWQIAGCSSLFKLGSMFPQYGEAKTWRKTAQKMLLAHLDNDFFSDGGHKERCWSYGWGVIKNLTSAFDVAEAFGGFGTDRQTYIRGLRKAYKWYALTTGPDEWVSGWGDGHLCNTEGTLELASPAIRGKSDRNFGADRSKSMYLKPSGYAIMRNGGASHHAYLTMSMGPFMGWHSHQDTLAFNFWMYGKPLIEEIGRFGSYDNPMDPAFRRAPAHNLVTVDGQGWIKTELERRTANNVVWHSDETVDIISGRHTPYVPEGSDAQQILGQVARTLIFVKDPGYVLVFDRVMNEQLGATVFSITQHWHSPCEFQRLSSTRAQTKGRPGMLMLYPDSDSLRRLEPGIDYTPEERGDPSDPYPARYHLRARRWLDPGHIGAVGFTTLLFPFCKQPGAVSLKPLPRLTGTVPFQAEGFHVQLPDRVDTFIFNPEKLQGLRYAGKTIAERVRVRLGTKAWTNVR